MFKPITPGPWNFWSGFSSTDEMEAQITASGGDIVVASYNHLIERGEANAKLMAAAPDLLESAELACRALEKFICPLDIEWGALSSLRAAIAKATE